jgi:hypothetical protein
LEVSKAVGLALEDFHLVWKPSVIPLLRAKRHVAVISWDQESKFMSMPATGALLLMAASQKVSSNQF